jgi:uncharacterized DUF497 family protein
VKCAANGVVGTGGAINLIVGGALCGNGGAKNLSPLRGLSLAQFDRSYKRELPSSMEFEWSAEKAALNLRKHGVAFEEAARVFLDPGRLEAYDGREDYGEDRWASIGLVDWLVLYVVYTVRHEDTIRIISARRAITDEQKQYSEANA